MTKPWSEMTPAERVAHRIARNRVIDKRVGETPPPRKKSGKSSEIADRQKAVRGELDKFEQIKVTRGLDAAVDFVRSRKS
ncbi:MAG TPA: hypothetical protein VGL82_11710 [Bryobacteraceae bacterium]